MRLKLFYLVFCLTLAAAPSSAEVYRWTDADGKVHYSTSRPSGANTGSVSKEAAQPTKVELPSLQKENIDKRIRQIQENTPDNCFAHGGIDCSQGADHDGSIICLDGYRDALGTFLAFCTEVKLQAEELQLFTRDGTSLSANEAQLLQKLSYIEVSVRNLSGVPARRVSAVITVPRAPYPVHGTGPAEIGSYGFAEYRLEMQPLLQYLDPLKAQSAEKVRVRIQCENCVTVQKALVAPKF